MKQEFTIVGMNCSHCRNSALKALEETAGVESATVDLATGKATVEGTASLSDIRKAIEAIGYKVKI